MNFANLVKILFQTKGNYNKYLKGTFLIKVMSLFFKLRLLLRIKK